MPTTEPSYDHRTPIALRLSQGWKHPSIEDLEIGQSVWIWTTGSQRLVTVTAKARTRITIAFEQKNGRLRNKQVPADQVLVPDYSVSPRLVAPGWIRTHHDRRTLVIGDQDVAVWRAADYVRRDTDQVNERTGRPYQEIDWPASALVDEAKTHAEIDAAFARRSDLFIG